MKGATTITREYVYREDSFLLLRFHATLSEGEVRGATAMVYWKVPLVIG
jgi:hypothetical protein